MTDCSTIYFPADSGRGIVSTIENGNIFKPGYENWLNWFLHELEHANQCINWGGRLNYADQWFSQLDTPVLAEIMENAGLPILRMKEIHDKMPMERQADSKANEIQSKLKLTPPMPSVRQPLNRVPLTIPESRLPTSRRIQ